MAYLLDMEAFVGRINEPKWIKQNSECQDQVAILGGLIMINQSNLETWNLFNPTLLVINVTIGNL